MPAETLTLLTPTGCRPRQFALCERMMVAQDYAGPVRWVIVDDGEDPQPVTFERKGWTVEFIRPAHRWRPGMNTQHANLLAGLHVIDASALVVCIEDDDLYKPGHLSRCAAELEHYELVGERVARYVNVRSRRIRELPGSYHASLASTACRGRALAKLHDVVDSGARCVDMTLWREFGGRKHLTDAANVIGVKGSCGRAGIGVGHRNDFGTPATDEQLRDILGPWADEYLT